MLPTNTAPWTRHARPLRRLIPAILGLACVFVPAAGTAAETLVVTRGATWRYLATPTFPSANWHDVAYDETGWPTGTAPLGYGEPFIDTAVPYGPDPNDRYRTTYFRIAFDVAVPIPSIQALVLRANHDDGFAAYLNGAEVARRAMPAGPISYGTLALDHEGGGYDVIDLTGFLGALITGPNLLAVELHQAAANSSDLALDMSLGFFTTPPVVTRNPYLQSGSHDRMTVRWRTDQFTDGRVRFGPSPGTWTGEVVDPTSAIEHVVTLTGLAAESRYYYDVGTSTTPLAGGDVAHYFETSPAPGTTTPLRVWVTGDHGTADAQAAAVRDAYATYNAGQATDAWVLLGDNAYPFGSDLDYQTSMFDMYPSFLANAVAWPARGNHDLPQPIPDPDYLSIFTLPSAGEAGGVPSGSESYYAFDLGNVHFICLDSFLTDRSPAGAMLDWLADDLAATTSEWVIAFWHHPPYTHGSHDSDNVFDSGGAMVDMRTHALPILEGGGVDLVLTGHSHSYERSVLIDGHYGHSSEYNTSHEIDSGDGRWNGDGPYDKPTGGPVAHAGSVYVVAGSAGQISGGPLDHPAVSIAYNELGSLVIDVDDQRLDVRFLTSTGVVRDSFTLLKGGTVDVAGAARAIDRPVVALAGPNPFSDEAEIDYRLVQAGPVALEVRDLAGRRVRALAGGTRGPGVHHAHWDGRDDAGTHVAPGIYWAVLTAGGRAVSTKLVYTR